MRLRDLFLAGAVALLAIGLAPKFFAPKPVKAAAGSSILTGTIKSAAGEKLAGMTVSAKAAGTNHHDHGLHR